jgi:hypothetical protein
LPRHHQPLYRFGQDPNQIKPPGHPALRPINPNGDRIQAHALTLHQFPHEQPFLQSVERGLRLTHAHPQKCLSGGKVENLGSHQVFSELLQNTDTPMSIDHHVRSRPLTRDDRDRKLLPGLFQGNQERPLDFVVSDPKLLVRGLQEA